MDLITEVAKLMTENTELHKRLEAVKKWTAQFPVPHTNGAPTETVKAKPGHKAAFTAAQIEELRTYRKAGHSAQELAKTWGVSLVTIYKYTKGHK